MIVKTIPAFYDNYIYAVYYSENECFVVDPSQAEPVLQQVIEDNSSVSHILLTHHHSDHTGGVAELKSRFGCHVISDDRKRIPQTDRTSADERFFKLGPLNVTIILTPGHTKTSVCYLVEDDNKSSSAIFAGDTLFAGGCGRLFECDGKVMWDSLCRLRDLPGGAAVYPGHDYTEENYEFALSIEADNDKVAKRLKRVKDMDVIELSTIDIEKQTNIFLRSDEKKLQNILDMNGKKGYEVFTELRLRKDRF